MVSKTILKVKQKMVSSIQKIFCFLWIAGSVQISWAGTIDIPLFVGEDTPSATVQPVAKKETPQTTQKTPSKPIKLNSAKTPNIGLNAKPLTQIGLVPPPFPDVVVDLNENKHPTTPLPPQIPTNTRVQTINIRPISDNSGPAPVSTDTGGDVRGFELNGFYLGMTPQDVIQVAQEQNCKITTSKESISQFRTGYYESICRSRNIYLPEEIRRCIRALSQQNDTTYLSKLKIVFPRSNETMEFDFSSPATDNRVWKIYYQNKGDNSLNFTQANVQKKLDRRQAFLNALYNKFGYPDNGEKLIWGSESDAFMQAGIYGSNYDAYIKLTDTALSDEDYFEAKDWLDENKPFEHFGFED